MGTAERRLEIYKYLCLERKASMPHLAKKFGVSVRTIQRDIFEIEAIFHAPIVIKKGKYGLFRKTEIIYGKPISYSSLGFSEGGRDEYTTATQKVFDEIVKLGDFSALPAYDPEKDTITKKQQKRRKRK